MNRNKDFEDIFSDTSKNEISDNESSDKKTYKEEVENNDETKTASTNKNTEADKAVFSQIKNLQIYIPRIPLLSETEPIISAAVTRNTLELSAFLTLFLSELFELTANCNNQRLEILRSK